MPNGLYHTLPLLLSCHGNAVFVCACRWVGSLDFQLVWLSFSSLPRPVYLLLWALSDLVWRQLWENTWHFFWMITKQLRHHWKRPYPKVLQSGFVGIVRLSFSVLAVKFSWQSPLNQASQSIVLISVIQFFLLLSFLCFFHMPTTVQIILLTWKFFHLFYTFFFSWSGFVTKWNHADHESQEIIGENMCNVMSTCETALRGEKKKILCRKVYLNKNKKSVCISTHTQVPVCKFETCLNCVRVNPELNHHPALWYTHKGKKKSVTGSASILFNLN